MALWSNLSQASFLSFITAAAFPVGTATFLHTSGIAGDPFAGETEQNVILSGFDTAPCPLLLDTASLLNTSRSDIPVPTVKEFFVAGPDPTTATVTTGTLKAANILLITPNLIRLLRSADPTFTHLLTTLIAHLSSVDTHPTVHADHELTLQWL